MLRLRSAALSAILTCCAIGTASAADTEPRRFTFNGEAGGVALRPDSAFTQANGAGMLGKPGDGNYAFSMAAVPGDYRVTVTLRSDTARSVPLWAEDRRVAAVVQLKPGVPVTRQFVVNVRDARLQKVWTDLDAQPQVRINPTEQQGRAWDGQLTVSLAGLETAVRALDIAPVQARRVLLAGDSTVASQAQGDAASWGQMLGRFLDPGLAVSNHARNGESLKSFLTSLRWDKLMEDTRAGDIVVLQFGHNDEKRENTRTYSAPDQAYPAYLAALIADIKQRGAQPVLVTPVARRSFNAAGRIDNSHAGYDSAVRALAARAAVPLVDLTTLGAAMYERMGPEAAKAAFAKAGTDTTHHNAYGAYVIACFVAHALQAAPALDLKLAPDAPDCAPQQFPAPAQYELKDVNWPALYAMPTKPQDAN